MLRQWMANAVKAGLFAWAIGASPDLLRAQECNTCNTGMPCATGFFCPSHHCGPPYRHCAEGPPNLKIKIGCPKPICNPCTQPNFGYYETCWSPWPWGNAIGHCRPPQVAMNVPGPYGPQAGPHPGTLPYANGSPEGNYQPAVPNHPQGFTPNVPLENVPNGINAPRAIPMNPNAPSVPQAIPQPNPKGF